MSKRLLENKRLEIVGRFTRNILTDDTVIHYHLDKRMCGFYAYTYQSRHEFALTCCGRRLVVVNSDVWYEDHVN